MNTNGLTDFPQDPASTTVTIALITALTTVDDPTSTQATTEDFAVTPSIKSLVSFSPQIPATSGNDNPVVRSTTSFPRFSQSSTNEMQSSIDDGYHSSSASQSIDASDILATPSSTVPPATSNSDAYANSCKIAITILATIVGIVLLAVLALCLYTPKKWHARGAKTRDIELAKVKQESEDWKGRYESLSQRANTDVYTPESGRLPDHGTSLSMSGPAPLMPMVSDGRWWR